MTHVLKTTDRLTETEKIVVRGARTHNLKNVDVEIPRNQFVVITGKSGSGKSSLAFDTIYAEGQRQYIESLSLYARQFLSQLPRPDVDMVEGLQPTLCLDQDNRSSNRRSTVGTVTELYDFLRLLMARVGDIHCYECGEPIKQQTAIEIRDGLLELPERTKIMILAPVVSQRQGQHRDVLAMIRRERLVRVRVNGEVHDIDRVPVLAPSETHSIEAVTDRIIIREGIEARLLEAIDNAVRISSDGQVICCWLTPSDSERAGEWQESLISTKYTCPTCDINYAEVEPRSFSFNSPFGACETCGGLGEFVQFDTTLTVDRSRSVSTGAVKAWQSLTVAAIKKNVSLLKPVLETIGASVESTLDGLSDDAWETFLNNKEKGKLGLNVLLEKELATTSSEQRLEDLEDMQAHITCHDCKGSRVSHQARAVFVTGSTHRQAHIGDIVGMPIETARSFFDSLELDSDQLLIAEPILREINHRLEYLCKVGIGYMTLGRAANTLSGGEHQRVRLASSIGSGLTSVCFVLDEPSIGLHQRDNERLIAAIRDLQGSGNSVIVVEHDEAMIRQADYLIDMGPGAGNEGGTIVAEGTPEQVADVAQGVTGKYLNGDFSMELANQQRPFDSERVIELKGAHGNNLKHIDVEIPLGVFVCVTGVSGSGKSTLVNQTIAPAVRRELDLLAPPPEPFDELIGVDQIDKMIVVDQRPIGRSTRACPVTFTGVFDHLRKLFASTKLAKQLGFGVGRFSFNTKSGWCPDCQGFGLRKLKMNFMPDLFATCESCRGRRFNLQSLQVRFNGQTISDVLEMTVDEAVQFFDGFSKIREPLQSLADVGLGYLLLGQPANTLSGGEAQRIKLATELAKPDTGNTLYLLDEPTTGLHFDDIRALVSVLQQLVDKGNSLVVIEHNLDLIRCADWVIDMGPDGGENGGQVVAVGTPEQLPRIDASITGRYLGRHN